MTGLANQKQGNFSLTGILLCAVIALIGCGQSLPAEASVLPAIVLSSSQTAVRAGGTVSLSAAQGGVSIMGGNWLVVGGPSYGTVDSNGTYQAPAIIPPTGSVVVQYLYKKSLITTTINILNPVPSVASVTPSVLSGPTTPVTVIGSNFVPGSQIVVNGGAIATTYLDAGHLNGKVTKPSSASSSIQIAVSNPNPGAVLSSSLGVQLAEPLSPPALPLATLHTPSYFMEQSDEFVGPFASWTNVKTAFGAKGDGITDDTAAIQNAISSLTYSSPSCVLWFPAGTYKVSKTLVFGHMQNFSVIGEDPGTAILKWAGAPGGTVVQTDGSTYFKFARLGIDGSGIADVTADFTSVSLYPDAYYSTFNELSDLHLFGAKTGMHLGIDAETAIERVFFDHLSSACLVVNDFNTLNIFVNDSLFVNCGVGLTNAVVNGGGGFVVSNSYFVNSQIADISVANTGPLTARHNTSVGAKTFFVSYEIYDNSSTTTFQNNTIIDPLTTPFQLGNLGPFTLIDNVVRLQNSAIPVIQASWTPASTKDVFSMGNVYTPNGGIGTGDLPFQGRVISYDDTTVPLSSIADVTVPTNVYVPPNLHRMIFEPIGMTGSAVQSAINIAAASVTSRPVVHLRKGIYPVSSTITLPVGSDVQLVGDDVTTSSLAWNGLKAVPVLAISTSNASVRNLRIDGAGEATTDGIVLKIADQPNMQLIMDQADLGSKNSYGVNFDGMEHANIEMFSTYTIGSITGVRVAGGLFRSAKEGTLGITNHYTGSLQSEATSTSFDVSAGGKYMVQDNWHDRNATSPLNFRLAGSGTVTEQGGAVFANSSMPFEIDNFDGNVTLMNFGFTGGFNLNSTAGQANLLTVGLLGASAAYLPSSTPNITVGNVLDAFGGGHIAQAATPDVTWMRKMLAQTRSEYPIARPALAAGANRIRLNRIMVDSTSSAVHILPDTTSLGLYYALQSGVSGLSNTSGDCVRTAFSNEDNQWLLMAAGDGDFEVVSKKTGNALGFAASPSQTLALEPLTGLYDQRWMANRLGDGNYSFMNRETGTLLSLSGPGGCAAIGTEGNTSWTVTAH